MALFTLLLAAVPPSTGATSADSWLSTELNIAASSEEWDAGWWSGWSAEAEEDATPLASTLCDPVAATSAGLQTDFVAYDVYLAFCAMDDKEYIDMRLIEMQMMWAADVAAMASAFGSEWGTYFTDLTNVCDTSPGICDSSHTWPSSSADTTGVLTGHWANLSVSPNVYETLFSSSSERASLLRGLNASMPASYAERQGERPSQWLASLDLAQMPEQPQVALEATGMVVEVSP